MNTLLLERFTDHQRVENPQCPQQGKRNGYDNNCWLCYTVKLLYAMIVCFPQNGHLCSVQTHPEMVVHLSVRSNQRRIGGSIKDLQEDPSKTYRRIHQRRTGGSIKDLQDDLSMIYMRIHQKLLEDPSKTYMRIHQRPTWGSIKDLQEDTSKTYMRIHQRTTGGSIKDLLEDS